MRVGGDEKGFLSFPTLSFPSSYSLWCPNSPPRAFRDRLQITWKTTGDESTDQYTSLSSLYHHHHHHLLPLPLPLPLFLFRFSLNFSRCKTKNPVAHTQPYTNHRHKSYIGAKAKQISLFHLFFAFQTAYHSYSRPSTLCTVRAPGTIKCESTK